MDNLETNRTLLRHFVSSDFDSIKIMLMDEDVMGFTGFKKAQSVAESKVLLEKWIRDDFVWAAINKETNRLVGWFMLKETISKSYPEIGFMIEKSCWNQGYASEIALKLITFARCELDVTKVIASTHINNSASIKVLKKIGMRESDDFPSKDNTVYYEVECW
jgi:ribosomal-protein-alanine N-acetyltransferase